jgi:hypothetical protein
VIFAQQLHCSKFVGTESEITKKRFIMTALQELLNRQLTQNFGSDKLQSLVVRSAVQSLRFYGLAGICSANQFSPKKEDTAKYCLPT